nr:leucine-rich repeat protein [Lachnospiraceae bacterium]
MKKLQQRILALWLAALVAVGGVPVNAFAKEQAASVSGNTISGEQIVSVSDNQITEKDCPDVSENRVGDITEEKTEKKENEAFYFEEYFEENDVKIILSAEDGVVPDGAYVQVEALKETELEAAGTLLQEEVEERTEEKQKAAASDTVLTVYDKYYDIYANLEKIYAFDFHIYYMDENGKRQIFEPEEGQVVHVSFEIPGIAEIVKDDMQEVDLHHIFDKEDMDSSEICSPEHISAEGGSASDSVPDFDSEIMSEKLSSDGDAVSFDATHFSIYAVTVAELGATADPAMVAAQKKAWQMIDKYADSTYGLYDPWRDDLTDAQFAELQSVAKGVISGCNTQYEKIEALARYVADTVYWDQVYLADDVNNPYIGNPYDVYTLKRAVCGGYSRLFHTLLTSVNIPCIDIYCTGYTHVFNAVYDKDHDRWIYIDVSWCSSNQYYGPNNRVYKGYNGSHFDLAPEEVAKASAHEVYDLKGLSSANIYYQLKDEGTVWSNMNWSMKVIGAHPGLRTLKPASSIDSFPVNGVDSSELRENNTIQSIDLSATKTKEIGNWTFYKCSALQTVKLPSTLTSLGECAFYKCQGLRGIDLSKTKVTTIKPWTFADCTALKTIKFPKRLTGIQKLAFYNCDALQKADMSSTKVKKIGESAFYTCDRLKTVKFPATLTTIEKNAFAFCKKITSIDLSSTKLKKLNKNVFYVCSSLKKIILPRTLKSISSDALTFCPKLKSVTIPKSVTKIANKAFNTYGMTIYGAKKSRAQKYAQKMKHTFKVKAPAKKIKMNKKKVKLSKGAKVTLTAKLVPSDSIDTIKWSSSNKKVAKVNSQGVVTAKKKGTAYITAKTSGGKKVRCKVTVK